MIRILLLVLLAAFVSADAGASRVGSITLLANWDPWRSMSGAHWGRGSKGLSRVHSRWHSALARPHSPIKRECFDWLDWLRDFAWGIHTARADNIEDAEWLVKVGFGEPSQQLQVIIDTGSPVSWVYSACCYSSNHSYFHPDRSKTFVNRTKTTSGDHIAALLDTTAQTLNISYLSGSTTLGYLGIDWLHFTSGRNRLDVANVTLGLVTSIVGLGRADDPLEGLLGLGPTTYAPVQGGLKNPLQAMVAQRLLKHPYLTMALERKSTKEGDGGRYIFGDLCDRSSDVAWTNSTSSLYWGGSYDSLRMVRHSSSKRIATGHVRHFVIDSGSSIIYLPTSLVKQVHASIHGAVFVKSALLSPGRWLIPCNTGEEFFPASLEHRTPSFVVDVGGSSFEVPPASFAYQAQNPLPASEALGRKNMCFSAFQSGPEDFIILGGTFLTSITVTLDLGTSGHPRIGFANRTKTLAFPTSFPGPWAPPPGWTPPQSQRRR